MRAKRGERGLVKRAKKILVIAHSDRRRERYVGSRVCARKSEERAWVSAFLHF